MKEERLGDISMQYINNAIPFRVISIDSLSFTQLSWPLYNGVKVTTLRPCTSFKELPFNSALDRTKHQLRTAHQLVEKDLVFSDDH